MKTLEVLVSELWLIPCHLALLPENKQRVLDLLQWITDERTLFLVARVSHRFYVNSKVLDYGEQHGLVTYRSKPYQPVCHSRSG